MLLAIYLFSNTYYVNIIKQLAAELTKVELAFLQLQLYRVQYIVIDDCASHDQNCASNRVCRGEVVEDVVLLV